MGNKSLNTINGNKYSVNRWSEPSLFVAIDSNDVQRVRSLLKSGHNINKRDSNGMTALHLAAINGSEECLQLLLQFRPKLISCSLRQTSLHFAAQNGTKNMINLLLDYGSVINAKDSMGCTPLANAVEVNNYETASALLMRGAVLYPNVCVCALQMGFTDVLKLLLNFKSNIIQSIDLKDFCFTRPTSTGLKVLYFCGFAFNESLITRIQPLEWTDFCFNGNITAINIRLPPEHYNRDQDFEAFESFTQWLSSQQQQPIPLKCLSRIAFRNACNQTPVEEVLSQLKGVPSLLRHYLLLNDI